MKKLVIILAIAIMLFATQEQCSAQPATVAVGASQNAATEQPSELPETNTEQVEKTTGITYEPAPAEATEETAVQSLTKEYTEETETQKATESEESVKCVDEGNQNWQNINRKPVDNPIPLKMRQPQRSLTILLKISLVKTKIVPEKERISNSSAPRIH